MNSVYDTQVLPVWVAPFGYPRINAYLPLPGAFRSLSRPSSASGAKAFPLRPFLLNLFYGHYVGSLCKKKLSFFSLHKIVVFIPENRKTYCSLIKILFCLALLLFVLSFALFSFQGTSGLSKLSAFASCLFALTSFIRMFGGLKWTRTIDLALIRRAL